MDKLAYSVPELAEVLGIGRNAAYELVQREDFPAVRVLHHGGKQAAHLVEIQFRIHTLILSGKKKEPAELLGFSGLELLKSAFLLVKQSQVCLPADAPCA